MFWEDLYMSVMHYPKSTTFAFTVGMRFVYMVLTLF